MKRTVFALVAFLSGLQVSAAAIFPITIENNSRSDIASFIVRGGEIEGSTRVPSGSKREVKVTLPDGKCRAELRFNYADPHYVDDDKVLDFCKYGGLIVS